MWPTVIITTVGPLLDEGTTAYSSLRLFASLFHNEAQFHQSEHLKLFYANVICGLYLLLQIHAPLHTSCDDSNGLWGFTKSHAKTLAM